MPPYYSRLRIFSLILRHIDFLLIYNVPLTAKMLPPYCDANRYHKKPKLPSRKLDLTKLVYTNMFTIRQIKKSYEVRYTVLESKNFNYV